MNERLTPVPDIEPEPEPVSTRCAVDALFHLDCLQWSLDLPQEASFEHTLDAVGSALFNLRVDLAGCTAVYCDPEFYPSREQMLALTRKGICVAIGVHPKAPTLSDNQKKSFSTLFSEPAVVALGEIGWDWTTDPKEWLEQERQFCHLLSYAASKDVVVVLYLRGLSTDAIGRKVYNRGLQLAKEDVSRNRHQVFHLHRFSGPSDVVSAWLQYFPNTYFGFTNEIENFNHIQCEGLRAVPVKRLLLETDAPYFPPHDYRYNAPHLVGITASRVAEITTENATRIYVEMVQM